MQSFKKRWGDCDDPMVFASHIFRIAFGIMFTFVAIKKLRMGYGGFAEALVTNPDSLLSQEFPSALLYLYGWIIPGLELLVGLMLLFDRGTRTAYKLVALIYLTFIFGQQYDGNTAKVGTEYLPSMVALAVGYYAYHKK